METTTFWYAKSYLIIMFIAWVALLPFFFGVIFLLLIPGMYNTKIMVWEKWLTITSGFFMKSHEDISYKKINNVVCETSFWSSDGTIKIYTGNNKPVQYTMIANVKDLKDIINNKIES